MHAEAFHAYCEKKPGAEACFPFDETTLVFKVGGKIFALAALDNPVLSVNLKCDPARALELRAAYSEIQPGWHMHKAHWNTVDFEGSLSDTLLMELIDHSYQLVFNKLPVKVRAAIEGADHGTA